MAFDGDFYTKSIHIGGTDTDPVHQEVNYYDLASSFSTSPLPVSAITSSSNSGYGHFAVWYDGQEVKTKLRTSAGAWKPGKPNVVANTNARQYEVYPNPVVNDLIVSNVKGGTYAVSTLTGQTVLQGTLSAARNTVQMSQLPSGTYIFTIQKNNDVYRIKIVKQ